MHLCDLTLHVHVYDIPTCSLRLLYTNRMKSPVMTTTVENKNGKRDLFNATLNNRHASIDSHCFNIPVKIIAVVTTPAMKAIR